LLLRGIPANRVIPVLTVATLILVSVLDFASVQPNRIVPGTGVGLWSGVGPLWSALLTLALSLLALASVLSDTRPIRTLVTGIGLCSLAALPFMLAAFAHRHVDAGSPYARVGIGAGFWCALFFLILVLIEALRGLGAGAVVRISAAAVVIAVWLLCLFDGALDSLSLVREFHNRSDQFLTALEIHLALALGSVGVSLVIGFVTAIHISRHPRYQRPVFAIVNFIQTVPSLALFGLLIAPLSALSAHSATLRDLGIRGIGWAPAALALVAYSLLPMVRNTYVALTGIPADLIEAGRGMGMSDRQLFRQVRLPLALPVIIEGVRVTTIQAIGLTAVAALIGAGGFGTFIFQGLGQSAMDLVLLGALPTIALAVLFDILFSSLARQLSPAYRRGNHD